MSGTIRLRYGSGFIELSVSLSKALEAANVWQLLGIVINGQKRKKCSIFIIKIR